MKKILLIIFLLKVVWLSAQYKPNQNIPQPDSLIYSRLTGDYFFENKYVIGVPYFNKDWENGEVLLSNGDTISNINIKYDGLEDELIWLNSFHFQKIKIDKASILAFRLNDSQTEFIKINPTNQLNDSVENIFAQQVVRGETGLYIRRMVSLDWPKYYMENNVRRKYDVLIQTPVYYFLKNNNKFEYISKLSRKNLLRVFPEFKDDILIIIRQNQLNLKKEKDLILLVQLLNQKHQQVKNDILP